MWRGFGQYAIWGPFVNNTKIKVLRFFGREPTQIPGGYFRTFYRQGMDRFNTKASGGWSLPNPMTGGKSFIKRKVLYYGGILFAIFVFLKSVPIIFATMITGSGGHKTAAPAAPQQLVQNYPTAVAASPAHDKDI